MAAEVPQPEVKRVSPTVEADQAMNLKREEFYKQVDEEEYF